MFEGHFGLRENPFAAAHQSRFIYPSPEHQEALAHLRYGIENREPFVLITGEVGTGKTTALFDALSEWEGRAIVGLITNSSLTRAELLEEIALRLGMSAPQNASKPQIMVALERHLLAVHQEGLRAILLLDEAQNLERELLEEIRLLSNLETGGEKLVQIFLVGQPELEGRLQLPELRQLRQRIAIHYRLRPLGPADAERYIHHRIGVAGGHALSIFPPDSCAEVHRLTHGIPREINHLCSQSMICAFVEGAPAVLREHVRTAAEELEFQSVLGKERRTRHVTPAVERRQGPTIPGAAPPPERETKAAAPRAATAETGPPALPALPAPERQRQAPASSPAVAGPAESTRAEAGDHADARSAASPVSGAWRPDPLGEDDGDTGPPRWNPAEFERRTDPADELLEEPAETDDIEPGEEPEPLDDGDLAEHGAPDDAFEEEDVAETGPPRLGAEPRSREHAEAPHPSRAADVGVPRSREHGESTDAEAGHGLRATPVPPREAPAPAASGGDWQSWFKSLASEAESSVREADAADPRADELQDELQADMVEEFAPPRLDAPDAVTGPPAEPMPEVAHDMHAAPQPGPAPAEPIVEPAAPSSAFAAALRRAQGAHATVNDAAEMGGHASAAMAHDAAPASTPAHRPARDAAASSLESLPPRLREKMARAAEAPRDSNPMPARIMIAAILLLVVIGGAIVVQRVLFSGGGTPVGAQDAGTASLEENAGADAADGGSAAPTPARASTPPAGAAAEAARGTGSPGGADASQAASAPEPAAPEPRRAPPEPAAAAPATTFMLAVGTYLNEERAQSEQTRLSASTRWQARIATVQVDDVAMYRVTMGDFPTRTDAERAASDLIARGLVDEARILPVRGR